MDSRLAELSLKDFLNALASKSPVPGGGSVAALCGALASSLAAMVCGLTIGKERYEQVQHEIQNAKDTAEELLVRFLSLVQEDTDAFQQVVDAIKLPKETDEQRKSRLNSIQNEMRIAANVPLETLKCCERLAELAKTVVQSGNQNTLTDAAAALHLAKVAGLVASYNVRINLAGIKDEKFVADCRSELDDALQKIESVFQIAAKYLDDHLPR